jgi:hypothetical protein
LVVGEMKRCDFEAFFSSRRMASRLMERASMGFWAQRGAPTRQASGMITSAFLSSGSMRRSSRTSPRTMVRFSSAQQSRRGVWP